MSVTARIDAPPGSARADAPARRTVPTAALARWSTRALIAVATLLAAGALGLGLYAAAHANRVYEGVEVADVRVGGMERDEARAALERRFAAYAGTPLTLTAGALRHAVTPHEAGARLDSAATVEAALAYGRGEGLWERSRAWARALLHGAVVQPRIAVDPGEADAAIRAFAPRVVRAATDAAIRMDAAGQPTLAPDAPGVTLDVGATRGAFTEQIGRLESGPIAVVTRSEPAAVPAAALAPRLDEARAAVGAALVLSTDEGVWHVPAADLKRIVSVDAADAALRVDRRPLGAMVAGLAAGIDRPAVDAGITVDEAGALAVVPGSDRAEVDVAGTVGAIEAALLRGEHDVPLTVVRARPAITDGMAAAAVATGERLIGGGMPLTWEGGKARLGRDDLLAALTIEPRPGERTPFGFGLDAAMVAELLAPVADGFDEPAIDARFRIEEGMIRAVSEARTGRALDVEDGVAAVVAAFGAPAPEASLAVRTLRPKYTGSAAGRIALGDDVLAEASTPYTGSSEPRRRNVERAAALENGWLVPPGEIFSYVENVGAVDAGNGFVTGFGIVAEEGGGVTTAPVIGGGICQVSTTIFQAAFWAGMPIEERYQHPYYLRSYGEARSGLPGLDAMVNVEEDWSLDLKFRNGTDAWLAVLVTADGDTVSARIVGTDPGWDVRVLQPEITNLVPKAEAMDYTDSPELPLGEELLVESAEDGFDVTIARTVSADGETIDEYAVSSSFSAARNLTLRGTGG